jgi:hypothetical protein
MKTTTFRSCIAKLALRRRALGIEMEAGQASQHRLFGGRCAITSEVAPD